MIQRHAANGITELNLIVGSAYPRSVTHGDLLLTWAIFVDGLFYDEVLFAERFHDIMHDLGREVQPDRAVDGCLIEGNISAITLTSHVKLVLPAASHAAAPLRAPSHHTPHALPT